MQIRIQLPSITNFNYVYGLHRINNVSMACRNIISERTWFNSQLSDSRVSHHSGYPIRAESSLSYGR